MLNIQTFVCNPLQENCYIVSDETQEAVVIDCGAFFKEERQAVTDYLRQHQLRLTHLIATHAHFDHNFGNDTIYTEFGVKPEVSIDDEPLMAQMKEQAEQMLMARLDFDTPPVGKYLIPTDLISFGSHQFTILPTPGHTPGSVVYYCEQEQVAFSGDTLFRRSIGRTDFALGSYKDMMESLHMLATTLPANTTVLCGHGPQTTMADELRHNPFLR